MNIVGESINYTQLREFTSPSHTKIKDKCYLQNGLVCLEDDSDDYIYKVKNILSKVEFDDSGFCQHPTISKVFRFHSKIFEVWKIINESNSLGNADEFFSDMIQMINSLLTGDLVGFNTIFSNYSKYAPSYATWVELWPLSTYVLI